MTRLLVALLVGLALGLAAGLLYSLVVSPVEFINTSPAEFAPAQRDEYVILVAWAYAADGNVERAQTRLAALDDADIARTVTALAQRAAAEGHSPETVAALSSLAFALGVGPGQAPTIAPIASPVVSTPPGTGGGEPRPDITAAATRSVPTPTATPVYEYELAGTQKVCDPLLAGPLIQAQVETADGKPIPGVEVVVTWSGGRDHFFTGFKPEIGLGYGDFQMTPETTYSVSLAARSQLADGLFAEPCEREGGGTFLGGWLVVWRRLP